jgi:hypothetical protein
MLLLSDGSVMLSGGPLDQATSTWFRLSPDSKGSYLNGTFTTLPSMSAARLFYASDVLRDGRVFVLGGEYSSQGSDTNTGEIYDPASNTWTSIPNFPEARAGDAISETLQDGRVLVGSPFSSSMYFYNPTSQQIQGTAANSWSAGPTLSNLDTSAEEGWVKLPDGSTLRYEIQGTQPQTGARLVLGPSDVQDQWVGAGSVPVRLDSNGGDNGIVPELGPGFLLPSGQVFWAGATQNTALYTPPTSGNPTGTWMAGPVQTDANGNPIGAFDAPGAVEPNGKVLWAAGPIDGIHFPGPTTIFEYDPSTNAISRVTPAGPNLGFAPCIDRMLVLPTGQILYSDGADSHLWVYNADSAPNAAWAPRITGIVPNPNGSYTLGGTQLNGMDQGAAYGDDVQMASNYPLISLTDSNGNVSYARTSNWNLTGVQTGFVPESVNFTLPAAIGALKAPVVSLASIAPVEETALTNVPVATFTDPNGNHLSTQYSATISWGDGTSTSGVISGPNANGVYTVSGTHTYTEEGPEVLQVTVNDGYATYALSVVANGIVSSPTTFVAATAQSSATIAVTDPAVVAAGGFTINTNVNPTIIGSQKVATFTDPGGTEARGDYSATINWGDGQTSSGTLTGPDPNGVFTVYGSHPYAILGTETIRTTISHDAAATATAISTAVVTNAVNRVSALGTAGGTFGIGASMTIDVVFGTAVAITGSPELLFNDGGVATYAPSGNYGNTIAFTYTVQAGQNINPLDEASTAALVLNGGTITNIADGQVPNLTLPAPSTAGSLGASSSIVIDTVAPTVVDLVPAASGGTWGTGANLGVFIDFSKPVVVTGTPQLALSDGSVATYAPSSTGSPNRLFFGFTVTAGQYASPLNEASTTALSLNGGTINDTDLGGGNPANLTLPPTGSPQSLGSASNAITINAVGPTVMSVVSETTNGAYNANKTIQIGINFSNFVFVTGSPELLLNDGGVAVCINANGSGSKELTFTYTVAAGQNINPLDEASTTALSLNGGTIRDGLNNDANLTLPKPGQPNSLSANSTIVIDTTAPIVTSVDAVSPNTTYGPGSSIEVEVHLSKPVYVTGTPGLILNDNAPTYYLASNNPTSTLYFLNAVGATGSGQNANPLDDYWTNTLTFNNGTTVVDAAGNNANSTLPLPGSANSLSASKVVVDTTAPVITSVSSPSNGNVTANQTITINVQFNKPVTVTLGSGNIELPLNDPDPANPQVPVYAVYTGGSGSGKSTLSFSYTVGAGQTTRNSTWLDVAPGATLLLNGGTIADAVRNSANPALPVPGTAGSLSANNHIAILNQGDLFVDQLYQDILGRPGTPGQHGSAPELFYWSKQLSTLGQTGIAKGVANSTEALSHVIANFYSSFLGRTAITADINNWVNVLRGGATEDTVMVDFLDSSEFLTKAGGTASGFVTALYQDVLKRTPSSAEVTSWVNSIQSQGGVTNPNALANTASAFVNSGEFRTKAIEAMYGDVALDQSLSYHPFQSFIPDLLKRDQRTPSGQGDPTQQNINFWLSAWANPSNPVWAAPNVWNGLFGMEVAFASTSEYWQIAN